MDCEQIRTGVSALLDGEDPGVDEATLSQHLATCASCRQFADTARQLHGSVRVHPATPVPDLTTEILERVGPRTADPQTVALRVCLVVIAAVQLVIAAPALLLGTEPGASVHIARHTGAFGVALAVGFLSAAWRPARASGILTITAALVACVLGAAIADVASGQTAALGESAHANELLGLSVLWMLQHRIRAPRSALAR